KNPSGKKLISPMTEPFQSPFSRTAGLYYQIKMKMKKINRILTLSVVVMGIAGIVANAQNPIIQTNYTADPAPMVYNDKLYLYTSHDEDGSTWFTMDDWRLYTTDDMVNWTDHGTVLHYKDFEWAGRNAWAPAAIER